MRHNFPEYQLCVYSRHEHSDTRDEPMGSGQELDSTQLDPRLWEERHHDDNVQNLTLPSTSRTLDETAQSGTTLVPQLDMLTSTITNVLVKDKRKFCLASVLLTCDAYKSRN